MKVTKLCSIAAAAALALTGATAESTADELFQAVRKNDLAHLKKQIKNGAGVNTGDKRGGTLLMHAAAFGSVDAMKLLLDLGADVNCAPCQKRLDSRLSGVVCGQHQIEPLAESRCQ